MDFIFKLLTGLLVFCIVEFLALNLGSFIGSGPFEIGLVVCAIALLCGVVVICTLYIIEAIKQSKES